MPQNAELSFRRARREDVPGLIGLLADDPLGRARETPDNPARYYAAFAEIDADPKQYHVATTANTRRYRFTVRIFDTHTFSLRL